MQITRRELYRSDVLQIGAVAARAPAGVCGEIERQASNVAVLPLAGVFAKHEGPRRQVIATPSHALLLGAGSPYRVSFPGGIGDRCLTLRLADESLAHALPHALPRDNFDSPALASHALLPPAAMLGRSLLWRCFARGEWDAVEVEELGVELLASVLRAARRDPHGKRRRAHAGSPERRLRQIERVKEVVSLDPGRKWTLGALADIAGVSPFHLARTFREGTGAPVHQYVMRARLAMALEAVLETDTDLTTLALDAGFAGHSHFTARFRALFGVTPTALRRRASARSVHEMRVNCA